MVRDVGRIHITKSGSGQITLGKDIAKVLPYINKDKMILEYDEEANVLTVVPLNIEEVNTMPDKDKKGPRKQSPKPSKKKGGQKKGKCK